MNFSIIEKQLHQQGWAMVDEFWSPEHCQSLRDWGSEQSVWKKAGTGHGTSFVPNSVRGDEIVWLPETPSPKTQTTFDQLNAIRHAFNQSLWLNLTHFEAHLAHYGPGKGYARHKDAFQKENKRVLSAVFYLNPHWVESHGGCLRLHLPEGGLDIEPKLGRAVFFMSDEIEHEVLESHANRWSLACWFLRSHS